MHYKVEIDEVYDGLRCVVIFTDMGHRCGYVGISKKHPFYGLPYNDSIPESFKEKWEEIKTRPIGKRSPIDLVLCGGLGPRIGILFDVHGGITFSDGDIDYPVNAKETWWFGFDCAHSGDSADFKSFREYFPEKTSIMPRLDGEIRTKEYVFDECKSLADQLNDLEHTEI